MKSKNLFKFLIAIFFVFAKDCVDEKTNKIAIKNLTKFLIFISPPNYLIQKSSLIIRETKEELLHQFFEIFVQYFRIFVHTGHMSLRVLIKFI